MIVYPYPVNWGWFDGIVDWVSDWWNEEEDSTEVQVGSDEVNTENQDQMQDAQVQTGTGVEQGVNTQVQDAQDQGQGGQQSAQVKNSGSLTKWLWIGGGIVLLIIIIALIWYFVVKKK